MKKTAVLLIAHGSRNAEANADLAQLVESLRSRGLVDIVEPAYLELAEPTIPQGMATCLLQGALRVVLTPYFLSPGVHACQDLAAFRDRFQAEHPGIEFRLAQPLGRHPLLVDIVCARIAEA